MAYNYGFPEYVPVAEKRRRAQQTLDKLKKKNPDICPVIIEGTKIAKTWWGKAWNNNLERYCDYANRIGRGRSYVRHGAILDLQITAGKINALVQGSETKPYQITITIKPLANDTWQEITRVCEGKLDSLPELMEGKFPKALADIFTAPGQGLFPSLTEISLDCSCPDWATMCKHVAAVLYGVGARLDNSPALFFILRQVNIHDLISEAIAQKSEKLLKKATLKSSRVIDEADISAIFGIDMEAEPSKPGKKATKKTTEKKTVKKPSPQKGKREKVLKDIG